MKRANFVPALALLALLAAAGLPATLADSSRGTTLEVTVTNVTRGQVLSPPVVIAHDSRFSLFTPGQAAGDELAQLAEDAVSDPLVALLGTMPSVFDVNVGDGPIPPGESATVEIEVRGHFRGLTVAGMLVTTNDAFYAATSRVRGWGTAPFSGAAWDAGSEANTESCEHIPGPPCGNPMMRVTEGAEGYVHPHAGVHGGSSLDPAMHDWNNPTAYITVRRVD